MSKDDINQIRKDLKQDGYAVFQYDDQPLHSYPYDAPWLTDAAFTKIYESIRDNTLVDRTRCYAHYLLMEQVSKVEGDVLEIGVWRGGTAGIFTQLLPDKTIYLADTFEGVVKSSEWEHYVDKAHDDTSEELVVNFLDGLGVTNYKILRGIFPEESGKDLDAEKLAYVHIDVDVYQSAKDSFEFAWERLSPGGIVAFDDFGFISACEGVNRFVNEIKDDADKIFFHNINGHAYIIKRG